MIGTVGATMLFVGVKPSVLYVPLRIGIAYGGNRLIRWLKDSWTNEKNQLRAMHSFILFSLYLGLFVLLRFINRLF